MAAAGWGRRHHLAVISGPSQRVRFGARRGALATPAESQILILAYLESLYRRASRLARSMIAAMPRKTGVASTPQRHLRARLVCKESINLFDRPHPVERLGCQRSVAGRIKAIPETSTGDVGWTTRRGAGLIDLGERSHRACPLNPGAGQNTGSVLGDALGSDLET